MGAVIVEGLMWAGGVVVREITAQQTSEMPFVDHDGVIEAFPSNRPDDTLGEGILPRGARGDEDLAHPQAFHAPCEHVVVDRIPIAEQVPGRSLFREALDHRWWAAQPAVGWSVTLTWTSSRRWCRRIKNPKSKRKVSVGTTKSQRRQCREDATQGRRATSRKVGARGAACTWQR